MKTFGLICLTLVLSATRDFAQTSEKVAREKMKPFAHWIGHWQGEGFMQIGPGQQKRTTVDEYLEFKLDSTVLLVEGVGKSLDTQSAGSIVHHALAILSFDQGEDQYRFSSYLKDGRATNALFTIIAEGKYQWEFEVPSGKIRYLITIDLKTKTWNEIGEFSNDKGTTWMKFFEMNLKKV